MIIKKEIAFELGFFGRVSSSSLENRCKRRFALESFLGDSQQNTKFLFDLQSQSLNNSITVNMIFPIGIDKKGSWHFLKAEPFLLALKNDFLPTFKKNDPHFPLLLQKVPAKEIFFSPCILKRSLDVGIYL